MTHTAETYLAVVVVAFLSFAGTLFWAMMTSGCQAPGHERHQSD